MAKKKLQTSEDSTLTVQEKTTRVNPGHTISDDEFEAAIYRCGGIVSWIASDLGCSNQNVYQRLRGNPRFEEAKAMAREIFKDAAEKTILKAAQDGNVDAAKFILGRIAQDRGWGEEFNINIRMQSMNLNLELLSVEELESVRRTLAKARVQPDNTEQPDIING